MPQIVEASNEITAMYNRNLALAASDGLYDRQAVSTASMGMSEDCSACYSANPACTGRLSDEASRFLLAEAYRADQVATYAQACWEWVKTHE